MTQNLSLRRWAPRGPHRFTLIAAFFWLTSYIVLSLWSALRVDAPIPMLSGPRFFGTLVGAFAFRMIVARLERTSSESFPNPLAVIPSILPATLAVLLTSLTSHQIWPNDAIQFNDHLRWVMVWAGYFGTGLGLFLACDAYGRMRACRTVAAPSRVQEAGQRERAIEAIAAELSAIPAAERTAMFERLSTKSRYDLADDVVEPESHVRASLVARIARRMPR